MHARATDDAHPIRHISPLIPSARRFAIFASIHILLDQHNIVWANGVETESFHPANTSMETLDPAQRQTLLALRPELGQDPHLYGDYARRNLSGSEAAILRHDGGLRLGSLQSG